MTSLLQKVMEMQVKIFDEIRSKQTVCSGNCDRSENVQRESEDYKPATSSNLDPTETKTREEVHDDQSSESVIISFQKSVVCL